jgi:NAD(P)-dependent dehydrogenase (short-subunit alcohol dehydrogenase family)
VALLAAAQALPSAAIVLASLATPQRYGFFRCGGQSFDAFEKEFFKSIRPSSLLKRFETPDEIARLVTFVCSPTASGINGAALRIDGGVVSSCF